MITKAIVTLCNVVYALIIRWLMNLKNMVMRFLTLCSGMFKVEIMFFMLTATEKVFSYVLGSQHQHFKMSFPQLVLRQ